MGLTTWKNDPAGAIRKTDVSIAKKYLDASTGKYHAKFY